MSLLLLLAALQSSPALCDSLTGNAKELCLTGYSEVGDVEDAGGEIGDSYEAMKEEVKSGEETGAEAAEAGAEAAAEGAEAAEAGAEAPTFFERAKIQREFSENWQLISITNSKTYWYIKGADLHSTSKLSTPIWIKNDHSRDKTMTARTSMQLFQFDCELRKTKYLAVASYGPDEKVLFTEETPYSKWSYVIPETMIANALDSVCME